jgi:hypothetical protein
MAKVRGKGKRKRVCDAVSALDVATLMQAKRTNDGTKQNYKSKVNVLSKWLAQHQPHALDDNTVTI